MTCRTLARLGATATVAAVAFGLAPTPAYAAGADFAVGLTGTTMAADAAFKLATLTVTNHGTTTPDVVDLVIDTTWLDSSKVEVADAPGRCRHAAGIATCRLHPTEIPGPGGSAEHILALERKPRATGGAGRLTVTVRVPGDTDRTDNSRTADVAIGDRNTDMVVFAPDVTAAVNGEPNGRPVAPGAVGTLGIVVANQGDMTAVGVRVRVSLPRQSAIAEDVEGCDRSADGRSLTCVAEDVEVVSLSTEPDSQDAFLLLAVPVRVARDAKGPVSLQDGVVTVEALDRRRHTARRAETASALPQGYRRPSTTEVAAFDADWTDNTDRFAVHVAGPAAGAGGGQAGGSGTGGGTGGSGIGGGTTDTDNAGGYLPVTGPTVLALGGAGLAVVALGIGLLLSARHRRVVLAIPDDGR